ncbi:hypothetical protein NMY22_g16236 [Coprinellus aureogranulatus]|nr:hypothetical protein NMY22_g16236 [Coprinellus aureogranulatus]
MSSKEQLAFATVRTLYGITIVSFIAIGIQLFVCSYGLSIFLETPKQIRRSRASYMIISWIIFLLFCLAQIGDAYQMFEILYHGQAGDAIDVLRLRHDDDHKWWRLASSCCIYIVNWIADGLLVYRCYIIWTDRRWVCILPCLTYLASMGMALLTFISLATSTSIAHRINTTALSAWIYLSVSLNFLVTSLISFKLLRLRRQMAEFMPLSELRVYLGVVAILVESAVPLTLTGLAFAIVCNPKSLQERIPNGMFLVLWFSLNAICPQMIIFRVTTGRSWLRQPEIRTSANADTEAALTNIAFTREMDTQKTDAQSHSASPSEEKVLDLGGSSLGPVIDVRR